MNIDMHDIKTLFIIPDYLVIQKRYIMTPTCPTSRISSATARAPGRSSWRVRTLRTEQINLTIPLQIQPQATPLQVKLIITFVFKCYHSTLVTISHSTRNFHFRFCWGLGGGHMSFPSPLIQKNGIHSSLTLGYTLKVKLEMYIHKYKLYWIDLCK